MNDKIYNEPSHVAAEKGEVYVDGPDGVAVSLTAEAAVETANRLHEAGVEAAGQKRIAARAAKKTRQFEAAKRGEQPD